MDSDFFTEGYKERQEIARLEARITELTAEINEGTNTETGRSKKHIEEEITELMNKKIELLSKLSHEENNSAH